ncbi:MAG: 50S ribosomal protein L15 [Candidatus Omnitrophica bacterium]|nr:50S ribosomal protein L15 [Candidatus Omnitrophota bacterium]
MKLSELKSPKGSLKRKKRLGRGAGSGHGKTSCRGHKGQKSRSGSGPHVGFEGGQMPLIRRIPKRGFTSKNRLVYQIVNTKTLNAFKKDSTVDAQALSEMGIVKALDAPIKILGDGELSKALTVKVSAFSASAKKRIEEAGGKVEIVSGRF